MSRTRSSDAIASLQSTAVWAEVEAVATAGAAAWSAAEELGTLPDRTEIERAADSFRRDHGLLTADDVDDWLDRWEIGFDEWMAWIARGLLPRGEALDTSARATPRALLVEAVCSGTLASSAAEVAARAPARDMADRRALPRWSGTRVRRTAPGSFPFVGVEHRLDCGPAALASVCRFYGRHEGLARLRDLISTADGGASLNAIVDAARGLGFHATAVKVSRRRLPELPLPVIAHVDDDHWVVLYRVGATEVELSDPAQGLVVVDRTAFETRWTGWAAVVAATPQDGRPGPSA